MPRLKTTFKPTSKEPLPMSERLYRCHLGALLYHLGRGNKVRKLSPEVLRLVKKGRP